MTSVSVGATGKAGRTPASPTSSSVPEISVPEVSVPEVSVPAITVPESSVLESIVPEITVRYWASARAAAGCDSERFTGHQVGEVLEAAAAAHTGLGVVLGVCTILLDGRAVTVSETVSDGATLEVLPPFAGG